MGKRAILAGISDRPEQLAEVVKAARAAGATGADESKPVRERVSALAREYEVADRRVSPVEPERKPEQLSLAV